MNSARMNSGRVGSRIYVIDNTDIFTSHYRNIEEYKDMMNRRKERLINYIKSDNDLLFIRQITNNGVSTFPSQENIHEFNSYIYKLNPNCKYKILFVVYTKDKIPFLNGVEYLLLNADEKDNIDLWNNFIYDGSF